MAKKRTQNQFENAVISGARRAFARYSPKYQEVLEASRVELPRVLKDGTHGKVNEVWHTCNVCKELQKKVDIDHIEPVIEIGKSRKDYHLGEYIERLDCSIMNLQVICEACHNEKSLHETKQRKVAKNGIHVL